MLETMLEEVKLMIEERKFSKLKKYLEDFNSADIPWFFEELNDEEIILVFRLLSKDVAAEVFVELEPDLQEKLIGFFTERELKAVMDELFMDDTVDLIEEMPANVVKRILKHINKEDRKTINELLRYPEDSAGSIMTTEFVDLKENMLVEDAFREIKKDCVNKETIYNCYVLSLTRKIVGVIDLKTLLLADKKDKIKDIMDENVIKIYTLEDKEEVAKMFDKYDEYALPVVDNEERLVGIITVDDAIDVMQEQTSEDIEKMAAILPSEKTYLKTGIFETFKSRIPWLLFLMISATFTGAIISSFEARLAQCIALVAFIPMLMGTGGNAGSQTSVSVIRALSLGDIEFKDIFKVIWKELRVSLIIGIVLGVINFAKLYLVDFLWLHTFDTGVELAQMATICLTLIFVIIVAKMLGAVLPIVAKKMGLDPAVMASPLVTTILDAVSLLIYFGIAAILVL